MQVFEHQRQEHLRGNDVQRLDKLSQHTLPRRSSQLVLQDDTIGRTEEPGHLHQPGGSLLAQQRHDPAPLGALAELA